MFKMVYIFLKLAGIFVFNFFYRVRVKGIENMPLKGRVILAANHASFLDPMVIFHICPRRFHAVVGKWLLHIWWLSWVFKVTSCVPTNGSSKGALAALDNEEAVLIFPEGHCEPEGKVLPVHRVHKGVAVFALKTGAPVIPIFIKGTFEAWPVWQFLPRFFKRLEVCFGLPFYFDKIDLEVIPQDTLIQVTNKIMEEIRRLDV
jgi:1-acyl-sn-glycerol-3-phosphate acyltransferase